MAQPLSREIAEGATCKALRQLYRVHYAKAQRKKIIQAIKEEKLIAILRKPDADTLPEAVEAMYRGGVRLLEITFDRSGAYPHALTVQAISSVTSHFEGRVLVGAGTVTSCEDVIEAFEAGASFIISPNCDPDVIALTKQLGLVSIPAAFTPTEIAAALQAGADFIKVFPADQLGKGYVKAVKAPLSDAKLLAVGGVNAENAGEFLKMGFCGVGVGSNLYNQALIRAGDFQSLTNLAKRFTDAVKE
jgi:2-dehydro-3-deoxyphosphogluconate aldolase/(4S)-4-hydroxy-2-oxoglutarate aldolase